MENVLSTYFVLTFNIYGFETLGKLILKAYNLIFDVDFKYADHFQNKKHKNLNKRVSPSFIL